MNLSKTLITLILTIPSATMVAFGQTLTAPDCFNDGDCLQGDRVCFGDDGKPIECTTDFPDRICYEGKCEDQHEEFEACNRDKDCTGTMVCDLSTNTCGKPECTTQDDCQDGFGCANIDDDAYDFSVCTPFCASENDENCVFEELEFTVSNISYDSPDCSDSWGDECDFKVKIQVYWDYDDDSESYEHEDQKTTNIKWGNNSPSWNSDYSFSRSNVPYNAITRLKLTFYEVDRTTFSGQKSSNVDEFSTNRLCCYTSTTTSTADTTISVKTETKMK